MDNENHRPKPSGWKWLRGQRGTWWYKETACGVRTGCPCCGQLARLGYPNEIRHKDDCPRAPKQVPQRTEAPTDSTSTRFDDVAYWALALQEAERTAIEAQTHQQRPRIKGPTRWDHADARRDRYIENLRAALREAVIITETDTTP